MYVVFKLRDAAVSIFYKTVDIARGPRSKVRGSAVGEASHPAMKCVGVRFVWANWSGVEARNAPLCEDGVDVFDKVLIVAGSVGFRVRYCKDKGVFVEELHGVTERLDGGRINGERACGRCN